MKVEFIGGPANGKTADIDAAILRADVPVWDEHGLHYARYERKSATRFDFQDEWPEWREEIDRHANYLPPTAN